MKQLLMARQQQQMDHDIDSQVIVNDFLSHQLSLKGYQWTPDENQITNQQSSSSTQSRRTEITDALRTLGEEYMNQYENEFNQMCEPLQISPSTAYSIFLSISNELFCEGIKWSHIVTYFVFGAEFALYTVQKGYPQLVSEISHWLSDYLNLHLITWIKDHGGWDGVIEFAQERVGQQNGHGHWRFGLQSIKNIIAAGALGALTVGLFLKTKS